MNKHIATLILTGLVLTPVSAQANDFFNRIDNALSTVENTMDRSDRAISRTERIQKRVDNKVPEGTKENSVEPASGNLTAKERETLRRAQEIEDRKVLKEAERIRSRRRN